MFWLDELVEHIGDHFGDQQEFLIRDEKTLSGRVHVGALEGVIYHGLVAQALNEKGRKARFMFEFNDVDPMDSLPAYLDKEEWGKYMGVPLRNIPSPDGKAKNFAEYWGAEFLEVIHGVGFYPEIVRASDLYDSGIYNTWIEKVLEHPNEIRTIYKEVSGSEKPLDWLPLQVVCEQCGKVGTTKVTAWNGSKASYVCEPEMVSWARGCSYSGRISPFDGRAKLPWKVEWPVKWAGNKVDIEGSGKDHNAAGGSRDIGVRICREILGSPVPFNIPYEFFLFEGAKMSSSKGSGTTAKEVFDSMPAELLRFLIARSRPNQPLEFRMAGSAVPRLYDDYDKVSEHYFSNEKTFPDLDRLYHFSQIEPQTKQNFFRPRFSLVSFLSQMPHLDYLSEITRLKGSVLHESDIKEAESREKYARIWLKQFASEEFIFELQQEIPEAAHQLSNEQKNFLKELAGVLEHEHFGAEDLHARIHGMKTSSGLSANELFSSIYISLLGKPFGPQAGWFLSALEKVFVVKRFLGVSKLKAKPIVLPEAIRSGVLTIEADVIDRFPYIKTAWCLVEGVRIEKDHAELTGLIDDFVQKTDFEDIKKNSEILLGFKQLYKDFGVDPTKRKPSVVALVDRLAKGKPFPRINVLVDLYNFLVIKHLASAGAFNADVLRTPLTLRFATHADQFQGIGTEKPKKLEEGELCFFDSSGLCIARDFNHFDSEVTKAHVGVRKVWLNMDGISFHSMEALKLMMEEFVSLTTQFCGGTPGEVFYHGKDA